jgi:hypothetical protein
MFQEQAIIHAFQVFKLSKRYLIKIICVYTNNDTFNNDEFI